jgi:hypothetical protein
VVLRATLFETFVKILNIFNKASLRVLAYMAIIRYYELSYFGETAVFIYSQLDLFLQSRMHAGERDTQIPQEQRPITK